MPAPIQNSNTEAPKPKKNIFEKPLSKSQADQKTNLKKSNQRNAVIQLALAILFVGLYSFYFFYGQLQDYLTFDRKIDDLDREIQQYEVTLTDSKAIRDTHKAAYDEQFKEEQAILEAVFPKSTDKIGVIRLMENFASHLNTAFPPFEFTSISFQPPEKKDGYIALPFSTSIKASQTNFDRFLGLVNLSGNVDTEASEHIRLMEITNISVNYKGADKSGKDAGVDFNVRLNAYSRP